MQRGRGEEREGREAGDRERAVSLVSARVFLITMSEYSLFQPPPPG